jgi:hypothetical protein
MSESNDGHEPEIPTAHEAEEAQPERRVRRSRQVHTDPELAGAGGEAEPAGDGEAAEASADGRAPEGARPEDSRAEGSGPGEGGAPKRRRRRRRRPTDGSEPATGEPALDGRRGPRERVPGERPHGREPRPAHAPGGRGERRGEGAAHAPTPVRTIYRQDVQIDPSRVQPPPARPVTKSAPKPAPQDKVTLILHPAPKAAPLRRSKKTDRPRTAKEALQAKTAKQRAPIKGA